MPGLAARNSRGLESIDPHVTAPRQVLAGQTYLVTRRCTQRQFLLRPDETTTRIFLYCLGEAAARLGIELLAWHASSNHYHAVVHDPAGELPLFLARFHKLCAKALNARWKRWENLWASEPTCAVRLVEEVDVLDKIAYTLANPVTDGLVERVFDWPGASSLRHTGASRPLVVERPKGFFRDAGPMPETVTLAVRTPRTCSDARAWAERVRAAVQGRERRARELRLEAGTGVVGRKNILRAAAHERPKTREPRRELRPHLGCLSRERLVRERAALRQFRADYAEARRRLLAGVRGVLFPVGTFLLPRTVGVRVAAAPS